MAETGARSTLRAVLVGGAATALTLPLAGAAGEPGDGTPAAAQVDQQAGSSREPTKSIGFYVGKDLTDDGSVLLGGFGHEPSSHWLEIVPRREFAEGATTTVGITDEARMPGELIEIPQARETNKYITSHYSEFAGFPAPLTNGGLNEHGVAARDIWSPSSERLLEFTDDVQTGPNYSDLSRIAMERASSAREAVEIVGSLIDEHGYSSYGGNSHLFADQDEGWVLVNYGGNQGLWAAERLGPDEARVSFPGYLNPFPVDFQDHPDEYLASDNFIDFAVEQGWFDPDESDEFDPHEVYGGLLPHDRQVSETHPAGYNMQGELEEELAEELAPVSLQDMMAYVRDPRWSHDRSGYGQVAQLSDVKHPELNKLWTAVTGAVTTPYVPIYIGAEDVPPEFKQHRYMTKGAAAEWLAADYAPLEATRYATRTFKRLMYHTCEDPETFLQPVTAEIEEFERDLLREQERIERRAQARLRSGREELGRELLTDYVGERLLDALELGEEVVSAVEERTREDSGIRLPSGRELPGETFRAESQSMNRGGLDGAANDIVHCYREALDDYPREHGAYSDQAGDLLGRDKPGKPGRPGELSELGGVGADVDPESLRDALDSARQEHDPDADWDAFADAVQRELDD
ncbi:peptidase U34 [Actinobacteria bacterium YIM 96077]|uniref:Peptidase U34 n=1 Tax=Phytoactinopolyspora halophila TaxID=1981511 RepID=A0A329QYW5_9ACTN|nr:C69 family dipeptidase [Phytoactinopolyspora halophila]AYY13145.1 peptidase U34 [Actinobacteria bacterium YIM 96077]RAW17614.1 peptidase U34 [Phytoactinopolyspora halophila]